MKRTSGKFEWQKHPRVFRCRICGAKVETDSIRKKYCDSAECRRKRLAVKNERRKARRHHLASLGFPIHTKGNK